MDRKAGAYLFLLAFLYSVPLWIQSVWFEFYRSRGQDAASRRVPAMAAGGAAGGPVAWRSP